MKPASIIADARAPSRKILEPVMHFSFFLNTERQRAQSITEAEWESEKFSVFLRVLCASVFKSGKVHDGL